MLFDNCKCHDNGKALTHVMCQDPRKCDASQVLITWHESPSSVALSGGQPAPYLSNSAHNKKGNTMIKLNKNGKPRKTFNLAVEIVKKRQDEAWEEVEYWSNSKDYWREHADNPEHASHYKMVSQTCEERWSKWHSVTSILHALEEIENA